MKKPSSELPNLIFRNQSQDSNDRRRSRTSSTISSDNRRWSEIVPSNSALTFAVVWDTDDEIVAFSGAELLDLPDDDANSLDSPSDAYDNRSQVLTIGAPTIPMSENTATLAFFRDNHEFLFSTQTPTFCGNQQSGTRTSSTLGGLDVYARGSLLGKTHKNHRHFSCLDTLDTDFVFDPQTSFANMWWEQTRRESEKYSISDEGFFEGGHSNRTADDDDMLAEVNLCSAFSTTTTSTSNYIEVEAEDDDDTPWTTLEAPNTPNFNIELFNGQQPKSNPQIRRLKKRRPAGSPAPPFKVLQREQYNHTIKPPLLRPSSWSPAGLPKFVRALGKWKRASSNDLWVCVEVTQEIHQHYI